MNLNTTKESENMKKFDANTLFNEVFRDLMQYNDASLREIAYVDYGIVNDDATREELAQACATVEVENSMK